MGGGLPEAPQVMSVRGVRVLRQGWEWAAKRGRGSRMDPLKVTVSAM